MKFLEIWIFVITIMIVATAVLGTIILILEYFFNKTWEQIDCIKDIWLLVKIIGCFLLLSIKISIALYIIMRIIRGDAIVM